MALTRRVIGNREEGALSVWVYENRRQYGLPYRKVRSTQSKALWSVGPRILSRCVVRRSWFDRVC